MKLSNTNTVLVSFVSLLFSATAIASECNDSAPLVDHDDSNNGYFNLDGRSISNNDKARLEKLAADLRGNWRGVELVKECEGHYSEPHAAMQQYKVRAEISRHETGAIRIEAEKKRLSDRVTKYDTFFISPEIDKEYGRIQGWHTLDFVDDNTVIFSQKSRVANGPNGIFAPLPITAPGVVSSSRLLHVIKKIELRDNKLTVDRKLYVNGYFVEQNGWILER